MSFFSGRADREKEARRQEDVARQAEERQTLSNQFLGQLVPGSAEYNELVNFTAPLLRADDAEAINKIRQFGSQLVTAQQSRIAAGGPASALEARTGLSFQGLREKAAFAPEEQALLNALRGITGAPGVEGEATQDIFSQLVRRAQDPNAAFTSTFTPQLQLLQDQVKARAAQRGLLGSGLELEDLGRTGVELAIREAQAREQFRQQQLQNFQSLFNTGQQLRGREIGVEEALLNLQAGRESNLTSLLERQTGTASQNMVDLLGTQTGRAEGLRDLASSLREAERQSREQFAGNVLFPGGDVNVGPFHASLPSGGTAFPSTGPATPSTLLASQQTSQTGGGIPNQAGTLSRKKPNDDLLAQLASILGGAA